jgi:transposase InsO family protein
MVKALLPKTRRAPAAAKKPAPPVEPEQPQPAQQPAAPQTPLEKELHRLYYDYKFHVGRDKLYWFMQQQQQKAAAAGREFPYFSHRLIQSWLRKQELSQRFRPFRNPIKSRSTTASAPFKYIAMDLTSLFSNETDQRFKWILTAIDLFTKKGWAVPMSNKDTASIHAAFEQMLSKITRNGDQRIGSLRTDNGSEFKSEFIKSYLGDKGIKQVFSSAYTLQWTGRWRSGTAF